MSLSHVSAETEIKFRKFVRFRATGETMNRIMHRINISLSTFKRWRKMDEDDIPLLKPISSGRPRITTVEDDELIAESALEHRFEPLTEWRQQEGLSLNERISVASNMTLYRRLNEKGINRCVAVVKQRLTEYHRNKRLNYANDFINWTFDDWSRVIFIDEFGIDTSDNGKIYVYRQRGQRFANDNITVTTRNTRQTFGFIASFSFYGLGPIKRVDKFNKEEYVEYLEEYLLHYINDHFEEGNFLLLHDNHPAHNSNYVKQWIQESGLGNPEDLVMPHPPCSPDLNPVEHVGGMLKHMARAEKPMICNKDELWTVLMNAHLTLSENRQYFIRLINSMPNRLRQVIDNEGGHTKY